VVHAHQWLPPQQTQHPGRNGDALQRGTHARPLGVADAVDIADAHAGLLERLLDQPDYPLAVVPGRVLGQEALAGRGDVGVADVGEHLRGAAVVGVQHDAHAQLVGGALEADGDHRGGVCLIGSTIPFIVRK